MPMVYWMDLFEHCHDKEMNRIEWPDGGSYLQQDNLIVEVFDVMRDESLIRIREKRKQEQNRGK